MDIFLMICNIVKVFDHFFRKIYISLRRKSKSWKLRYYLWRWSHYVEWI